MMLTQPDTGSGCAKQYRERLLKVKLLMRWSKDSKKDYSQAVIYQPASSDDGRQGYDESHFR